tara:strand:+ start:346 stop:498 length:153 start_codon:yes stop_codon:yes gene_type:complete
MESNKSNKTPTTKEFISLEKKKNIHVEKYKYLDNILSQSFNDTYFRNVKK